MVKTGDTSISFNPAEAEEGFKSNIQLGTSFAAIPGFNPAEAEEGFKRDVANFDFCFNGVSIQPKPKKGLKVSRYKTHATVQRFNPAEAEEGFKSQRVFSR